jgi:glycosyltransferase involved in cell wall biosynthesis
MPKSPRITVITPSLNQAEFLERTICSVLDQGYENLEYIVMDGGSCDGSVEVIQQYADDLAYWQSESNAGPADAINQAIDRATGDIIAILNADDLYLPGTLHDVANRMQQQDAPDWVVGHCLRIGENDEQLGQIKATRPIDLAGFIMHDAGLLPASASFCRKSVFEANGQFDTGLQFAWSYEWNCRLVANGLTPEIMEHVLSAQREHARSKGVQNTLRCAPEYTDAAARYANSLPFDRQDALWAGIEESRHIFELARLEMAADPARRILWRQLLRRPWWLANDRYRQTLLRGVTHPDRPASKEHDAPLRRAA